MCIVVFTESGDQTQRLGLGTLLFGLLVDIQEGLHDAVLFHELSHGVGQHDALVEDHETGEYEALVFCYLG